MPWPRAYAAARDLARPLPAADTAIADAAGLVLAAPILSATPVPAFDSAAMDGYAIRGPGPWTVTGRVLAGRPLGVVSLAPGTAVEIATGAPLPEGTDAVLPYEDCARDGPEVTGSPGPRRHLRRAGEAVRAGDTIVPAGRRVTATVAAAAVQAGVERVAAHRAPTVTLLVTGDEVITHGTPGPGQVRDSFTGLVTAITTRAGGRVADGGHVPDDPDRLRAALGAATGDVIAVSGSSSAGAADHLHTVLADRRAVWHVCGVACRPGHPQGLAELPGGRRVVSLPGNPYAGLVAALTLLEPLLRTLAGEPPSGLPTAPVTGTAEPIAGRARILPVRRHGPSWVVASTGSASLHTAAAADALAVLTPGWTDGDPAAILAVP